MIAIAIDGPAGAGKSTIAKHLARVLEYIYVDTGALYRAIGWYALSQGEKSDDEAAVTALLPRLQVELRYQNGEQRVLVSGEDVTEKIRTPEVSMAASQVSAMPAVRQHLFQLQRQMAQEHNVVMDGRDIGTVVLPQAQIKIFLTADAEDRARRRYEELLQRGEKVTYDEVLRDIRQRDDNDSHRAVAPLKQAPDALLVDTTGHTLEQSIQRLTAIVKERLEHVVL